jgi:pimeloyl-ACP methyl ester carboxylesterase
VSRPRLLLVPEWTEIEWAIRPLLEQWAEIASFDIPGVGEEPPADHLDRRAVADRGLREIDRRAWDSCFIVADGWGIASALLIATAKPEAVRGLALGHMKLSYRREGERAPLNKEVYAALTHLVETDHEEFLRHGITQATGGSIDEERAARMVERFPREMIKPGWEAITRDDTDIAGLLSQLDCPLLFAQHKGCLGSTAEGFEDAAAAFPQAKTISVPDAPLASPEFAEALREFCTSEQAGPTRVVEQDQKA